MDDLEMALLEGDEMSMTYRTDVSQLRQLKDIFDT